jgi:hypothetical protein
VRERIYAEIETERQAQDALWGGPAHDDAHPEAEWIALLTRHLGLAVEDGPGRADPARWRRQMLRVAALAVAVLESADRVNGRARVAGEYERGAGY